MKPTIKLHSFINKAADDLNRSAAKCLPASRRRWTGSTATSLRGSSERIPAPISSRGRDSLLLFWRDSISSPKSSRIGSTAGFLAFGLKSTHSPNGHKKFELEPMAQISGECLRNNRRETQKSCPLNIWGQDFVMIERQQVG